VAKREIVDATTGEIISGTEPFAVIRMDGLVLLDQELTASDFNVMGYIVFHSSRYGYMNHPQRKIGKMLGLKQSAVSRSVKHLIERGHISWATQNSRKVLKLNTTLISKRGSGDLMKQTIEEERAMKEQLSRLLNSVEVLS
jgi:DNA-binding MarR family transcriptional regulator